jgi:hypothetical protein
VTQQTTKNSEKILSFRIGDKFIQKEMERHAAELEEVIAKAGQVRLLIIIEKFPMIDLGAGAKLNGAQERNVSVLDEEAFVNVLKEKRGL